MPKLTKLADPKVVRATYENRLRTLVASAREALDRRDDEIRRLHASGAWSLRQLSGIVGVSYQTISNICTRRGSEE